SGWARGSGADAAMRGPIRMAGRVPHSDRLLRRPSLPREPAVAPPCAATCLGECRPPRSSSPDLARPGAAQSATLSAAEGLAGGLVALVAACAAVILLQPSQHKPVVISHRPTAASTASPAASASAGTSPARQEARSVNALLARSSGDRSEIVAAAVDIANCGDLSQDQEALESAARSRQMLLDQLSQLSTAKLPHSKGLVSMLTAAWRAS